jgi:hypothetical protein
MRTTEKHLKNLNFIHIIFANEATQLRLLNGDTMNVNVKKRKDCKAVHQPKRVELKKKISHDLSFHCFHDTVEIIKNL